MFYCTYVQILLNSTSWELGTHEEAYKDMKKKLGLDQEVFDQERTKQGTYIYIHAKCDN